MRARACSAPPPSRRTHRATALPPPPSLTPCHPPCPPPHTQTETYWGNVNCIGERSCYDEGKRAAETLTMDYHREHGLEVRAQGGGWVGQGSFLAFLCVPPRR